MSKLFPLSILLAYLVCCVYGQSLQCTNATDCFPAGYVTGGVTVPPSLVNCSSDGGCVCRDCFDLGENGRCTVDAPCQTYDTTNSSCNDHRRSQTTALVLAAVLSVVGAANFYVARYEYAIPQLVLLMCLIVASSFGRILRYCLDDKGRSTEKFFALCSSVTAAVVAVLSLGVIVAWWIADVIIFARNARRDGENCPLREDL